MSRVEAAAAMDRLPWLPDNPTAQPARRRSAAVTGSALTVVLLVGGAAFWFGVQSVEDQATPASTSPMAATTVRLPAARPAAPVQPQVKIAPVPEVEPIVAPTIPVVESAKPAKRVAEKNLIRPRPVADPAPAARDASSPVQPERLQPWPVRVVDGAAGRLVRVGAFSSVHQAKRGWWAIVRANPTLEHLPALVVPVRSLRSGRVYYRLQMGTTSQAHSA
ncbi:MAG: hypothetical protein QOF05_1214, partial [Sphingomonadales bacterium]|nr:hypothetical protein [Sphingomonadales bacterium]